MRVRCLCASWVCVAVGLCTIKNLGLFCVVPVFHGVTVTGGQ